MAISLETLRSSILTSLHGRRIGLDPDSFLVGPKDLRKPVTAATSDTTGTALPNHGFVTVTTTTNDGWSLTDPTAGCEVTIMTGSSSTGNHAVVPAAATIISTNGVDGSSMILQGNGAHVKLVGVSTSQWVVSARGGSTTAGQTVVISS